MKFLPICHWILFLFIMPKGVQASEMHLLVSLAPYLSQGELGAEERHLLRSPLDETSHFYIDSYHIQLIPKRWNSKSLLYEGELVFNKRGLHTEEKMTSLPFRGKLKPIGQGGIYAFQGVETSQIYKDTLGRPILNIQLLTPSTSSQIADPVF